MSENLTCAGGVSSLINFSELSGWKSPQNGGDWLAMIPRRGVVSSWCVDWGIGIPGGCGLDTLSAHSVGGCSVNIAVKTAVQRHTSEQLSLVVGSS